MHFHLFIHSKHQTRPTFLTVAWKPRSTAPDDTFSALSSPHSRRPLSFVIALPQSVNQGSITHAHAACHSYTWPVLGVIKLLVKSNLPNTALGCQPTLNYSSYLLLSYLRFLQWP